MITLPRQYPAVCVQGGSQLDAIRAQCPIGRRTKIWPVMRERVDRLSLPCPTHQWISRDDHGFVVLGMTKPGRFLIAGRGESFRRELPHSGPHAHPASRVDRDHALSGERLQAEEDIGGVAADHRLRRFERPPIHEDAQTTEQGLIRLREESVTPFDGGPEALLASRKVGRGSGQIEDSTQALQDRFGRQQSRTGSG